MTSQALAQLLRAGSARTMIDRILRAAADVVGVEFLVLGVRHGKFYEMIATHGVPVASFFEIVPAKRLGRRLFDQAIEVENLQAQPGWANLAMFPIASQWRYGANVPIKLYHPVNDNGVFALSVADRICLKPDGKRLARLAVYAEFISDCIWLVTQIHLSSREIKARDTAAALLLNGVRNALPAVALVGEDLRILGSSRRFAQVYLEHFGQEAQLGQLLSEAWLSEQACDAVRKSLQLALPVIRHDTAPLPDGSILQFDFYAIRFDYVGACFGLLSLHVPFSQAELAGGQGPRLTMPEQPSALVENAAPVIEFLSDTLCKQQRILSRDQQAYVAIRKWRAPIKQYQLTALKALKRECPAAFVDQVANEIVASIRNIHGDVSHCVVVPMPCGHSGDTCFSFFLGKRVAQMLNLDCQHAFTPIAIKGSSHPKTNVHRARMNIAQPVTKTALLIDDVATSGAHIAEASVLLRRTAPGVLPFVWIAD